MSEKGIESMENQSDGTVYHSVLEKSNDDDDDNNDKLKDFYGAATEIVDVPSDPEDCAATYIVNIEPSGVELFLIVSDVSIKEKDILNGR